MMFTLGIIRNIYKHVQMKRYHEKDDIIISLLERSLYISIFVCKFFLFRKVYFILIYIKFILSKLNSI